MNAFNWTPKKSGSRSLVVKDKNILLVGGNSGVGLEIARSCADSEAQVFIASRTIGDLEDSRNIHHQIYDATDSAAELDLPDSLDAVVYCPGSINLKPFNRLSDDDFLQDLEVNLLGAVRTIRQALPKLKKAGNASIVLFSTVATQTGMPFHAGIASAKGAVEGLTRSLAAELAPDIRVNCLALSLTDTPLAAGLLATPEKRDASASRHPLKRIGDPAEVAKAATFLLGADSGFITGQVIQIDGGLGSLKLF